MTDTHDLQLASLLASKICHDLISPISAINNGLELIAEDDDPELAKSALALVQKSAVLASCKLQIMRAAFGAGQVLNDQNSPDDLTVLCADLLTHHKIILSWNDSEAVFSRDISRLLINMIFLSTEILHRGGHLRFDISENQIICLGTGDKIIFPEDKQKILESKTDMLPTQPREVSLYVLKKFAQAHGYTISFEKTNLDFKMTLQK